MKLNILIGGKAGQGINKISEIVSEVLISYGYFTFNYRDYPSLIRGGHNFNILCFSDKRIGSIESKLDFIIAMDENTVNEHKKNLKKDGIIIDYKKFESLGRNLNIALSGALMKVLGFEEDVLLKIIQKEFNNEESILAAKKGYDSQERKFNLVKLKNQVKILSGSQAVSMGAINSKMDLFIAYPMTPATGLLHELASKQVESGHMVFQSENEVGAINQALGASFTGAKTMVGTSGGGYDLMTEGLSFQGMSEIPLVLYLCSRPGPGTGLPTYTMQNDLDIALRGGHGEAPRIVIAPGDPIECIEKTNEAFYLSEEFNCLSIILSDKHLAESEFSSDRKPNKILSVKVKRAVPGKGVVKATSYEHDKFGNTTEDAEIARVSADNRIAKYKKMKDYCKKFEMIKIFGNKNFKFLQVIYMKPLSNEIKKEMLKAKNVILVEQNVTGQLGRLIREKTGLKIDKRILRYDGRPFTQDELKKELLKNLK